jgi:HD-like signal output (HDOD) protein
MAEVAHAMGNEETTLNLLTNLILKNVSLTTIVLRVANSVNYNPGGRHVLSVSRAVTMMGWDSISHLAAGVLVFEHFGNQSAKLKELVLLMMLSGSHARQIAIHSGMRGIEEAYLCGMFRNLGELVVACYLPAEYAKILAGMNENRWTEAESCERTLKFRYEDLGKGMARYWNLPETVANCMDNPNLSAPDSELERLRIVSSFSHALSEVVYRTDGSESHEALKSLLKKYGPALPVRESDIPAILEAGAFETKDTFRVARLPMDHVKLSRQIAAAMNEPGEQPGPRTEAAAPAGDSDVLNNLLKELAGMLETGEDLDLNAVFMMILEALYRGAGLDRALFCLVDAERTHVQARLGVGADVEPLIEKFRFPVSLRSGPIGAAMLRKEDLIVDAGAGAHHSRSPFMNIVNAPCFGILPLVVDGIAAGCLYFDSASDSFVFDARKRKAVRELRSFAVMAISRARKGS